MATKTAGVLSDDLALNAGLLKDAVDGYAGMKYGSPAAENLLAGVLE